MCEYTVERAAANLPQSTHHALFTVSGGRVVVTSLVGEVTTGVQNQSNTTFLTAYNPDFPSTPVTVSTSIGMSDLADGMLISGADGAYYVVKPQLAVQPLELPSGGSIHLSCAASNTGQVKWLITYEPLDPGAAITAA